MTSARSRKLRSSTALRRRVLSVYAGRDRLGAIVEKANDWSAFGPTGRRLGTFKTRALALATIDALPITGRIVPLGRRRAQHAKAALWSDAANG